MTLTMLGDVVEFIRGVTFDASDVHATAVPGVVPILRAGNIGRELDTGRDLLWVTATRVSAHQRMRVGDIAICMSSGSPSVVGKSAILEQTFDGSVGAFCGLVRSGQLVDPHYLAHWLRSSDFFRWRDSQSRGVGIQNLRFSQLARLRLDLPSITEQGRIAAKIRDQLAAADSATIASVARARAARSLRSHAYVQAFQSRAPIRIEGSLDAAPNGWSWNVLTTLARLETGHTPSRNRPDWWSGEIPWIALPDIRRLDGGVAWETVETTNAEGIANSSARILPADTVVMSRTASVGFVTRMGRPMATSQDFVNWVCGPDLDPEFLMHLLIRSRDEIRSLSSGAIHKTVYMPTLKALQVCVPGMDEQRRIAADLRDRLTAIDAIEASIRAEEKAIDALPAALLRRAFGELVA